jgi:UDP-glucuronate 4-epimerase
MPMQRGDVLKTQADVSSVEELVGEFPKTGLKELIRKFVDWYVDFYKVKLPR